MEGSRWSWRLAPSPRRPWRARPRRPAAPSPRSSNFPEAGSLSVEVIPLQSTETRAAGAPSRGAPRAFGGQTLFVIRDETARRATERMRRDFATNVSHELKTPLAGLSLLAETLGHAVREDPEQAEKFVDRLSTEIGRLTDLANDLLTLSRLEEPEISTESRFRRSRPGPVWQPRR